MAVEPAASATPTRPLVLHECNRSLLDALANAIARNGSLDHDFRSRRFRQLLGVSTGIFMIRSFSVAALAYNTFVVLASDLARGLLCTVVTICFLRLSTTAARVLFERRFVPTLWAAVDAVRIPSEWVAAWLKHGNFERLFWEIEHRAVPAERSAHSSHSQETPSA